MQTLAVSTLADRWSSTQSQALAHPQGSSPPPQVGWWQAPVLQRPLEAGLVSVQRGRQGVRLHFFSLDARGTPAKSHALVRTLSPAVARRDATPGWAGDPTGRRGQWLAGTREDPLPWGFGGPVTVADLPELPGSDLAPATSAGLAWMHGPGRITVAQDKYTRTARASASLTDYREGTASARHSSGPRCLLFVCGIKDGIWSTTYISRSLAINRTSRQCSRPLQLMRGH